MELTFTEFIKTIALEYDFLNGLEKKVFGFFFNFKAICENQPIQQSKAYLNDICSQFKAEKERLVTKQTYLDSLRAQPINGNYINTEIRQHYWLC